MTHTAKVGLLETLLWAAFPEKYRPRAKAALPLWCAGQGKGTQSPGKHGEPAGDVAQKFGQSLGTELLHALSCLSEDRCQLFACSGRHSDGSHLPMSLG